MDKIYRWFASSNDGSYEISGRKFFSSKEDCYNDMRDAVLKKMKWNTEFLEDFGDDDDIIGYDVKFSKNKIVHTSYSGTYTYEIDEFEKLDERYGLTMYGETTASGGRIWIDRNDDVHTFLYMDYLNDEYVPMNLDDALTCVWNAEGLGGKYYLCPIKIQDTLTIETHYLIGNDLDRLVWLNSHEGFDGIVYLGGDELNVMVASLQDVRERGLDAVVSDKEKRTYRYENRIDVEPIDKKLYWGERVWEKVKELPLRENTWKVIETKEFTLWMDNEYGEMYLCKADDIDNIYRSSF